MSWLSGHLKLVQVSIERLVMPGRGLLPGMDGVRRTFFSCAAVLDSCTVLLCFACIWLGKGVEFCNICRVIAASFELFCFVWAPFFLFSLLFVSLQYYAVLLE